MFNLAESLNFSEKEPNKKSVCIETAFPFSAAEKLFELCRLCDVDLDSIAEYSFQSACIVLEDYVDFFLPAKDNEHVIHISLDT